VYRRPPAHSKHTCARAGEHGRPRGRSDAQCAPRLQARAGVAILTRKVPGLYLKWRATVSTKEATESLPLTLRVSARLEVEEVSSRTQHLQARIRTDQKRRSRQTHKHKNTPPKKKRRDKARLCPLHAASLEVCAGAEGCCHQRHRVAMTGRAAVPDGRRLPIKKLARNLR
jgi:hypothetical protein